jgi:hypothetical protein
MLAKGKMKLLISLAILLQAVGCVSSNQLQSPSANSTANANLVTSDAKAQPTPSPSAEPPTSTDNPLIIDRDLSEKVTLTNEWLELTPKEPLKAVRDTQEVTLFPDPPIKMVFDGNSNLVPGDGRVADIEAELIDSNGGTHQSRSGRSETMTGDLRITSRMLGFQDLPKDITYTKVRIRSSASYPVKKILWRCYNWSEVRQ